MRQGLVLLIGLVSSLPAAAHVQPRMHEQACRPHIILRTGGTEATGRTPQRACCDISKGNWTCCDSTWVGGLDARGATDLGFTGSTLREQGRSMILVDPQGKRYIVAPAD